MIPSSPIILSLVLSLLSLPSSSANTIQLSHNKVHHLARRDGDGAWLLREKAKLDTKYGGGVKRNIEERSRGGLDLAAEVDHVGGKYGAKRDVHGRYSRRGVTLADHNSDASYSASVSIGTPSQQFDLAIDTGSSDLWVADTSCSSSSRACSSLTVFQTGSSSSLKNSSTTFRIAYGSGSASGTLATDTVALGGYSVVAQTIALVDEMSAALISSPMSGIMGFGFQPLSVSNAMPWWQSLASSSGWSQPLFGVYLQRFRDVPSAASTEAQGGVLTLGGTDSSLYSGSISYVSVSQPKYWNIPIACEWDKKKMFEIKNNSLTDDMLFPYPDSYVNARHNHLARFLKRRRYRHRNHPHWRTPSRRRCHICSNPWFSAYGKQLSQLLRISLFNRYQLPGHIRYFHRHYN
jgi:hypothetical protein